MTVRERILALRLLERQVRDPVRMRRLGVEVRLVCGPAACRKEERRS